MSDLWIPSFFAFTSITENFAAPLHDTLATTRFNKSTPIVRFPSNYMNPCLHKHTDYLHRCVVFCGCRYGWVNARERKRGGGSMCTLCHEGQWIATKRLYYRCSLIKSTCKHRRCQFIHTVARETSPKRLELSGYHGDPPPHTVRKLLLSTCVGLEGLIPLQHLNFILIQTCLKRGGGREPRIPEVSPRPLGVFHARRGEDRQKKRKCQTQTSVVGACGLMHSWMFCWELIKHLHIKSK